MLHGQLTPLFPKEPSPLVLRASALVPPQIPEVYNPKKQSKSTFQCVGLRKGLRPPPTIPPKKPFAHALCFTSSRSHFNIGHGGARWNTQNTGKENFQTSCSHGVPLNFATFSPYCFRQPRVRKIFRKMPLGWGGLFFKFCNFRA